MKDSVFEKLKLAKPIPKEIMRESTLYYNERMTSAEIQFQSKNRKSQEKAALTRLTD